MNEEYYIGLDVHKQTVAIAYALGGSREDATYHGTCKGSVLSVERSLRRLAKQLGLPFKDLKVCYEAGPTGFVLQRHLASYGIECAVMAPTKTTRKPGEKVKTDKRDARKIAREFRNGDITEVHVPPPVTEAVRDWASRSDDTFVLPHPSWRNTGWLKKNRWFETELIPHLRAAVADMI